MSALFNSFLVEHIPTVALLQALVLSSTYFYLSQIADKPIPVQPRPQKQDVLQEIEIFMEQDDFMPTTKFGQMLKAEWTEHHGT